MNEYFRLKEEMRVYSRDDNTPSYLFLLFPGGEKIPTFQLRISSAIPELRLSGIKNFICQPALQLDMTIFQIWSMECRGKQYGNSVGDLDYGWEEVVMVGAIAVILDFKMLQGLKTLYSRVTKQKKLEALISQSTYEAQIDYFQFS